MRGSGSGMSGVRVGSDGRLAGVSGEDTIGLDRTENRAVRARSLRLLAELVRPHRRVFLLTAALVLLSQGARVAGPLLIAFGVDRALPALQRGDYAPLLLGGAGYVAAAAAAGILTGFYVFYTARLSQAMLLDLRLRVFRHTQRLSLEFHEKYTSGRIISRQTSDLEALRELLDNGITQLASGVVFMAFTAAGIFALDWRSGLLILAAAVPIGVVALWYQKRSQLAFRAARVTSSRLIVHFVETMRGIRAVLAFRREPANAARYEQLAEEYRRTTVRSIRLFGVLQPSLVLIGNVTVGMVLLAGGFRVLDGALEIGVLLALVLYAKRIFQPLEQMAMFYNAFQSAGAALEKVSGLLEEVPTVREPADPLPLPQASGEVEFRRAEFRYGDGPVVLPEFDLRIPAGQTVAVVGRTGAGKSTVAKLIARFYDVTSGAVLLDGVDVRRIRNEQLRRAVVMVTQEAFLFTGTVAENIALGKPDATREELESAARAVGAHTFIEKLPEGYDTDVNKRGGRLSAGQRQLISFARAVLADPPVLILDEATSSLDIPGERLVQEGLKNLLAADPAEGAAGPQRRTRTALIIAHRLSTVAIADRVLVMARGRIVEDGSPEELIARGGEFARLHAAWQDSLAR